MTHMTCNRFVFTSNIFSLQQQAKRCFLHLYLTAYSVAAEGCKYGVYCFDKHWPNLNLVVPSVSQLHDGHSLFTHGCDRCTGNGCTNRMAHMCFEIMRRRRASTVEVHVRSKPVENAAASILPYLTPVHIQSTP